MNEQVSADSDDAEQPSKKQRFPLKMTIRIDWQMYKELELVTLYERKNGSSTLVRDWLTEKLRGYDRNPHFIKFKNQMAAQAKRDAENR